MADNNSLQTVRKTLEEVRTYYHAASIISYDQETICPPKGKEEQGELMAFLANKAFVLRKDESFIKAALDLYEHREELPEKDRILAESLHRDYLREKNITPEMDYEFSLIFNRAFVNWEKAKQASDFSIFEQSLGEVADTCRKQAELKAYDDEAERPASIYDSMLDDYERGMDQKALDECFDRCKKRLIPLLKEIEKSGKKIRTDFLTRPVTDEQQKRLAEELLGILGFDRERGAFTTSEHPFTNELGKNDIRITTNYDPDHFASSMYSIIHECGHALFGMNLDPEDYEHFIENNMTLGMHESVSRFYENRIGRSRAFAGLVYPKIREVFSGVFDDVSEEELYEAINIVQPSLIRTEADEFTYILHIIIRYELEREIISGDIKICDIPAAWNARYEEYLGITPPNDREGVLQDVHWSGGFGYFPTYSLGDMYNSMYLNCLKRDMDVDAKVAAGDFAPINAWMKEHVFAKANCLKPSDWIKDITGKAFTPDDFLDHLEKKYSSLYGI